MSYFLLGVVVITTFSIAGAYMAFSMWFDARYPTAAEEIARQDVEHLLQQVNDEFYSRPTLQAPATIYPRSFI